MLFMHSVAFSKNPLVDPAKKRPVEVWRYAVPNPTRCQKCTWLHKTLLWADEYSETGIFTQGAVVEHENPII